MSGKKNPGVIIKNKKAWFNYDILDKYEAGIVLRGSEVKSLRLGLAQLNDSYVVIKKGEAYVHNIFIPHFKQANRFNHEEKRIRKLLLKSKEISSLFKSSSERNFSIIPLALYWKKHLVKLSIAVARGRKLHDKREAVKKKEAKKEIARAIKDNVKF